jgi:hypothetical protein
MEAEATDTRSYRTSEDGLVIYDAGEPCAFVASSVCIELEDAV